MSTSSLSTTIKNHLIKKLISSSHQKKSSLHANILPQSFAYLNSSHDASLHHCLSPMIGIHVITTDVVITLITSDVMIVSRPEGKEGDDGIKEICRRIICFLLHAHIFLSCFLRLHAYSISFPFLFANLLAPLQRARY